MRENRIRPAPLIPAAGVKSSLQLLLEAYLNKITWIVGTGMRADGGLSSAVLCSRSADNSASNAVTNRLNIASNHTNNRPARDPSISPSMHALD